MTPEEIAKLLSDAGIGPDELLAVFSRGQLAVKEEAKKREIATLVDEKNTVLVATANDYDLRIKVLEQELAALQAMK